MIRAATPYLHTHGRTERAFALYAEAFGARVEQLVRARDLGEACAHLPAEAILHAELRVGDGRIFLADGCEAASEGGNVQVAVQFTDEASLRRAFDVLAATGTVRVPVHEAPWNAWFGAVTDEIGIPWMLECPKPV